MFPNESTHGLLQCSRQRVTGSGHLTKRSEFSRVRSRRGSPREILIVDDEAHDAERLTATLHVLFGYQVTIRWARSLGEALQSLAEGHPSITFLDDDPPSDDALSSIMALRGAGYNGPIIVVARASTKARRAQLIAGGAGDVILKDEADSVRVAEAVDRAHHPEQHKRQK
jgi:CheY-like chemotaxis protein